MELLQQVPEVREYYQRKFRYVLVDEYQDTNHVQYLLDGACWPGSRRNICVVGDDDQSIYRFRGATIENILSFEESVPRRSGHSAGAELSLHPVHSGCGQRRHFPQRRPEGQARCGRTTAQGSPSSYDEAGRTRTAEGNFVAGQILSTLQRATNFKDYAVLYRTNAQSNSMEYALKRNGIPYRVIGGMRFFERAEIKDMLSYLCVINNRADDLRLNRIINNPPRGLGAKTVENVQKLAQAEGKSVYEVVCDPYNYGPLEKSAQKLLQFCT